MTWFKRHTLHLFLLLSSLILAWPSFAATPSFPEVKSAWKPSEAWLLDRNGEVIGRRRVAAGERRLEWVPLEELSPALVTALLEAEDKRFFEHGALDWQSLAGSILDNLKRALEGRRPRGASTLTMQLAAFLEPALAARAGGRSLAKKWDQVMAAREIEAGWEKRQILEAYLNLAPFRGEMVGVHAAALGLFRKLPSGLSRDESLLLAALLRGPQATPATVAKRACAVAAASDQAADCAALNDLALSALGGRPDPMSPDSLAPHLARRLLEKAAPGERLASTLDARVQRQAIDSLEKRLAELAGRRVADGAVVVLENSTGNVLAWVGSSGGRSRAELVDGALAPRQAGSTLKPFLYGLALEKGLLTAASVLEDGPLQLATPGGLYVPQNYDRDFKGPVSVRTALASSLNVPAVRALTLVGVESFAARLRALGLDSLTEEGGHYGYGLALGDGDVRLLQLANAYRTLARGGRYASVRVLAKETSTQGKRIMPAPVAFIVGDMLADRGARAPTFGLENPLALPFPASVKTGTSKDMRDNWCLGFSSRYTVGVWVGNADGSPMQEVSGVSGAAPVWRDLMLYLHADQPGEAAVPPAGLVRRGVNFVPAFESARQEWFVMGSEIAEVRLAGPEEGAVRILAPAEGSRIALDPDIPAERRAIRFRASMAGFLWRLDGRPVGEGITLWWPPEPGKHRLALVDGEGKVQDEVGFEVRGTPVP